MDVANVTPPERSPSHEIVGYLNFSEGPEDPRFYRAVNEAYRRFEESEDGRKLRPSDPAASSQLPTWKRFAAWLESEMQRLQRDEAAFKTLDQAQAVFVGTFQAVLPAYLEFHRDLLFHHNDDELFRPFFLARVLQSVLRLRIAGVEDAELVPHALEKLNDFIGHRPTAVLQNDRKHEPYEHEWVAPIPVYLAGAGFAEDRYRPLLEQALAILRDVEPDVQTLAYFDPALLQELAVDPRAYDFDHPVNKRPNYHFGQWDPQHIDQRGRYRRFVLQEVTLHAIWQRTKEQQEVPRAELLFEAGAVLAGTMLMASTISGNGPDAHDSSVTLSTLLPRIVRCREEFYSRLLKRVPGEQGDRLRAEAETLRQPFGGARQHLNQRLARLRAVQLQHVHLAQLFAKMGYADAARRQAQIVPVASARMLCEINGLITTIHQLVDRGLLPQASAEVPEAVALLHRAIECGALVDPWNILGFQGQFSLFPALENTVRDHRVDVLVHLVKRILSLLVRLVGEAAASGERDLQLRLQSLLDVMAEWWDQFAAVEVSGIDPVSGRDAVQSAEQISEALGAWHAGGAEAGDIQFWRKHVAPFTSPKAYALVVETLLDKRDYVAAMGLLMQWLGRFGEIALVEGDFSFHALASRWLNEVQDGAVISGAASGAAPIPRRDLIAKFFDYLEANADDYWNVPRFEFASGKKPRKPPKTLGDELEAVDDSDADANDGDEDKALFGAAYEDVVYRDSTRDGNEGNTVSGDDDHTTEYELEAEAQRLITRLALTETAARLWKTAVVGAGESAAPDRDRLEQWYHQAEENRRGLLQLLDDLHAHDLPAPRGTHASLVEYDRRRQVKEDLEARVIIAAVETIEAGRMLLAAMTHPPAGETLAEWSARFVEVVRGLQRGDRTALAETMPRLRTALLELPILYVPLAKGGKPREIVEAQSVQAAAVLLLQALPRAGLLAEAYRVISVVQLMERHRPTGDGAVTEFDRLFQVGFEASVQALIDAVEVDSPSLSYGEDVEHSAELYEGLQSLTEGWLKRWNTHSRSLRLSSLEKAADKKRWEALVEFIKRFGRDLFTPKFLNLGNLRAVLHQKVDVYLRRLEEDDDAETRPALLDELDKSIPRAEACELLTITIETLIESYGEFKDYNSTTTQSDQGDMLYVLLDFLRLRLGYERFAWNLRPVMMVHEVLVRRQKTATAELWRRAVTDRTCEAADWHLTQLRELNRKYGVRLPTIADRLGERFVRLLAVDRLRALIRPAIVELRTDEQHTAFSLLEQELHEFTDNPSGSGLDVPAWLLALEDEARRVQAQVDRHSAIPPSLPERIPRVPLSWEEALAQVKLWETAG
ncbi:MAG: hypothetical protein K8U03_13110 [Planctomycetia bacterium]|nr:hypothetical protein [Planctomycetia bacterium]